MIVSIDSGGGARLMEQEIPGTEPVVRTKQFAQNEIVSAGQPVTDIELQGRGIYTVSAGFSADNGETILVSNTITILVYECLWMSVQNGGTEYICYIDLGDGEERSFITDPQNREKSVDEYLRGIGY